MSLPNRPQERAAKSRRLRPGFGGPFTELGAYLALLVALFVVICLSSGANPLNPLGNMLPGDPGGRILAQIQSAAFTIPSAAHIQFRTIQDSMQDSCAVWQGRSGGILRWCRWTFAGPWQRRTACSRTWIELCWDRGGGSDAVRATHRGAFTGFGPSAFPVVEMQRRSSTTTQGGRTGNYLHKLPPPCMGPPAADRRVGSNTGKPVPHPVRYFRRPALNPGELGRPTGPAESHWPSCRCRSRCREC